MIKPCFALHAVIRIVQALGTFRITWIAAFTEWEVSIFTLLAAFLSRTFGTVFHAGFASARIRG